MNINKKDICQYGWMSIFLWFVHNDIPFAYKQLKILLFLLTRRHINCHSYYYISIHAFYVEKSLKSIRQCSDSDNETILNPSIWCL